MVRGGYAWAAHRDLLSALLGRGGRRGLPPANDNDDDGDDGDDEDCNAVIIEHELAYEKRRDGKEELRGGAPAASPAPNAPSQQPGAGPSKRRAKGAATTVG